jgi:hypothetical protein
MPLQLGVEIPSTPADGKVNRVFVPKIADIHAPTLEEINAGTDLSNYVMLGGWNCEPSQDAISDQRENSTQDFETPGRKKLSGPTVEVIDNTNTDHEDQNAAMETLTEGVEGFWVTRRGMDTDKAFAADQIVGVYAARIGMSSTIKPDANTVQRSTISWSAQAPGWDENAKVAGTQA